MHKKILSCFLALVLCCTLTLNALATTTATDTHIERECFTQDGLTVYSEKDQERVLSILIRDDVAMVTISYFDTTDVFYSFSESINFVPENQSEWNELVIHFENFAQTIPPKVLSHYVTKSSISTYGTPGTADVLIAYMEGQYGNNYENELIRTDFTTYSGLQMRLYESQETFNYVDQDPYEINRAMTISEFITAVLGEVASQTLAYTIGTVMGISNAVLDSTLPEDEAIQYYTLKVNWLRYTTINNSDYMYSFAEKIIRHYGFENLNSESSLEICDKAHVEYSPSSSLFSGYTRMFAAAYEMYQEVGQQP